MDREEYIIPKEDIRLPKSFNPLDMIKAYEEEQAHLEVWRKYAMLNSKYLRGCKYIWAYETEVDINVQVFEAHKDYVFKADYSKIFNNKEEALTKIKELLETHKTWVIFKKKEGEDILTHYKK